MQGYARNVIRRYFRDNRPSGRVGLERLVRHTRHYFMPFLLFIVLLFACLLFLSLISFSLFPRAGVGDNTRAQDTFFYTGRAFFLLCDKN